MDVCNKWGCTSDGIVLSSAVIVGSLTWCSVMLMCWYPVFTLAPRKQSKNAMHVFASVSLCALC